MWDVDRYVSGMAFIRVLGALVEIGAAGLMVRFNRVEYALKLNALLGLVGPLVLIIVTVLGVAGLAGRISTQKIILIFIGVYLMLLGSSPD